MRKRAALCACLCVRACVCAPRRCVGPPVALRGRANIARPSTRGRPRGRVCVWCHRPVARTLAAGVTWRCRTSSVPWRGRAYHTSVIDAAGAIYVIGGGTSNNDVWASTDGGARTGLGQGGWLGGTLGGYYRGTQGGTTGALPGYSRDTTGRTTGCSMGH